MAKKTTTSKRVVKVEAYGEAHISSTFNNVIVSLTNAQGQVISWGSAGKSGFRGSKKNTPYAAQVAAEAAGKAAQECGVKNVEVRIKGPGPGRAVTRPQPTRPTRSKTGLGRPFSVSIRRSPT